MSTPSFHKGFSVIEVIVTMAIMVAISTMIFINQKQFGTGTTLRNISNNLSLELRQAQVYGISVKEYSQSAYQAYSINSFNAGYGVSFNIAAPPTGDNTSYIFFNDERPSANQNPNGIYDSGISCPLGSTSECIDKTTLDSGYTITKLCTRRTGVLDCSNTELDVTFIRPNVEANIIFNANPSASAGLNVACVEINSPDNKQNAVVIYTTGQVSVQSKTCSTVI